MSTWRWEAHDPHGEVLVRDVLTDPWPGTPAAAAEMALAHLMVRAGTDVTVLRGWRVRAWSDGAGEAWCDADAWLRTPQGARR